jgi:hypothetical protein
MAAATTRTRGTYPPVGEHLAAVEEKAKAHAAAVVEPSAPQAVATLTLPVEVTFHRPRNLKVVLVGAGGTGARLGPDIARLLSRGDTLTILDHDTVEERNLIRQHFVRRDVGKYKAEVVASRATQAAGPGVAVEAQILQLSDLSAFAPTPGARGAITPLTIFIGAVDNRSMRMKAALQVLKLSQVVWVDAGNEMRGGQVGLMANAVGKVSDPNTGKAYPTDLETSIDHAVRTNGYTREQVLPTLLPKIYINTLMEVTPLLLQPDLEAEAADASACGMRLDTQSLAANVMAYSCIINIVSRLIDELPLSTAAAFFSTSNTMKGYPFTKMVKEANNIVVHTGQQAALNKLTGLGTLTTFVNEVTSLAKPLAPAAAGAKGK